MKLNRKALTAVVAVSLTVSIPFSVSASGIPVVDVSNLTQNLITAFNAVRSTAVQAEQYLVQVNQLKTQLDSYIQQMKDAYGLTEALKVYQEAQQTMAELQGLQFQFQNTGQLTSTLNQFQDVNYWTRVDPSTYGRQPTGSKLQKQTDDAWVKSLAVQQQLLQRDANKLETMQTASANAQGQMQALQTAAQLAASEEASLLDIRALMVSQQQALAAREMTIANEEAMRQAATEKYDTWNYQPAAKQSYRP